MELDLDLDSTTDLVTLRITYFHGTSVLSSVKRVTYHVPSSWGCKGKLDDRLNLITNIKILGNLLTNLCYYYET